MSQKIPIPEEFVEEFTELIHTLADDNSTEGFITYPKFIWDDWGYINIHIRSKLYSKDVAKQYGSRYAFHYAFTDRVTAVMCTHKINSILNCLFVLCEEKVYVYAFILIKFADNQAELFDTYCEAYLRTVLEQINVMNAFSL